MLSQEFALPDVLRIWDSLLSDETRCDLLIEVCVAMIMLVREKIMVQEFPENMKLLQVRAVRTWFHMNNCNFFDVHRLQFLFYLYWS